MEMSFGKQVILFFQYRNAEKYTFNSQNGYGRILLKILLKKNSFKEDLL